MFKKKTEKENKKKKKKLKQKRTQTRNRASLHKITNLLRISDTNVLCECTFYINIVNLLIPFSKYL